MIFYLNKERSPKPHQSSRQAQFFVGVHTYLASQCGSCILGQTTLLSYNELDTYFLQPIIIMLVSED